MLIWQRDMHLFGLKNTQNTKSNHGFLLMIKFGEMAEWFKAHAWKACLGETLSWVRIPLSPPFIKTLKIV